MSDTQEKAVHNNPFTNFKLPLSLRIFLSVSRGVFRVLGVVSPRLGGKLAVPYFMTPPRFGVPRRERAIRHSAELHFEEIHGNKIAVRSWGEGPVVLLSHGWGGRGSQFFALIEPIVEAGYRVVAFDAPAHGDSSEKRTTMLDVSGVISTVAERYGPVKALIGHSFGCGTALLAIDMLGMSAQKVILIGSFADVFWIADSFGDAFAMNEKIITALRQELSRRYRNVCGVTWEWHQLSPKNTIKNVTGDILLIHDQQDSEVPYEHVQQMIKVVPDAELMTTNGLGHRKILANQYCIDRCVEFIQSA